MLLNFKYIRNNEELLTYLKYADNYFESIGYKEHGLSHALFTAERAADVLRQLGYTARIQELAKIAGFLHDIGNLVGRTDHPQSGAVIAMHILSKMDIAEEMPQDKLLDYADEMQLELMTDDDGSIIIMDDKDLTMFVNLLNEDYYISPVNGKRYEIKSKKLLGEPDGEPPRG